MLDFNNSKTNCTGCAACASVCPKGCIEMLRDGEGFLYPAITQDGCIACGRCEKVCPMVHGAEAPGQDHLAFAALTRDTDVWRRSASGGAFTEICRAWEEGDTLIVGAAWEEGAFRVHHVCVHGTGGMAPLCRSKYIASDMDDVMRTMKRHLGGGGRVVFCGTPCQVAGVRGYMGRDYDNLLLVDLVCHGVGSPLVFGQCMEETGKYFSRRVVGYDFRVKRRVYETLYLSRLTFDDGTSKYVTRDPYTQLFLAQHCLRPSCGKACKFRRAERQGDITIADFKGLTDVFPRLKGTKRNYSTVVLNTPKGRALRGPLSRSMHLLPCSVEDVVRFNPLFARQTWFSEKRDAFFADFAQAPAKTIAAWTTPCTEYADTLTHRVFGRLPVVLRRILLGCLGQ